MYSTAGSKLFVNLGRTVTPAVDGIVGVDVAQVTDVGTGNPVALASQTPSGLYDSDFAIFNIDSLFGGGVNGFTPNAGWATFGPPRAERNERHRRWREYRQPIGALLVILHPARHGRQRGTGSCTGSAQRNAIAKHRANFRESNNKW